MGSYLTRKYLLAKVTKQLLTSILNVTSLSTCCAHITDSISYGILTNKTNQKQR